MKEEPTNSVQAFGGKHFKLNVEQDETPHGVRAHLHSAAGDDIEMLLQSRGLDVGQLMELALLAAIATVVVGLLRWNVTRSGRGE